MNCGWWISTELVRHVFNWEDRSYTVFSCCSPEECWEVVALECPE
jgi:hypothetical protein